MKTALLTILLLSCLPAARAAIEMADGSIELSSGNSVTLKCGFSAETDVSEGISTLKVWRKDSPENDGFLFKSEPGDQFLETVRVNKLSPHLGDLLFVYWERGSSLVGLTIIGLKSDGSIGVIFEDACRNGYQVLDLNGDGIHEIIAVDGKNAAGKYLVRIYNQVAAAEIKLTQKMEVPQPHSYSMTESKALGPESAPNVNAKR